MLKRISIILLLASITLAQSPFDLYNSAIASLEAGEVTEAENGFNAALEADPTFAPAYAGLSKVAIRNGDLKKAGELLNEAISADEENKEFRAESEQLIELRTLMDKGKKSMQNTEADDAFESFRIAYEKFPNYPESVYSMGVVMVRTKKYEEALEYFKKTIEINKEFDKSLVAIRNIAGIYYKNGQQLYQRGDLEAAMKMYEKSISTDESLYQSLYQIGMIHSKLGEQDEAIDSYRKVLNINPKHYKSYLALALAKKRLDDLDGALLALESAVDINPGYDKAYGVMGDIYINSKNYEKAKQVLNMAITVNPNYAKGYASFGILSTEEQNWEQAIAHLTMATTLNDRDAMSFFRLAGAYNATGDCAAAKDAARNSTSLKSRFGGAWFELGIAEWCGGKGNKTGAINAFKKARNDRTWRNVAEHEMDKVKNPQKYEK